MRSKDWAWAGATALTASAAMSANFDLDIMIVLPDMSDLRHDAVIAAGLRDALWRRAL
jgi:hypothetical protein